MGGGSDGGWIFNFSLLIKLSKKEKCQNWPTFIQSRNVVLKVSEVSFTNWKFFKFGTFLFIGIDLKTEMMNLIYLDAYSGKKLKQV